MANSQGKQTYTAKGRLRTSPMPYFYGKEWALLKRIDTSLAEISTSLKDLVQIEKEKLEAQHAQVS